MRLLLIKWRHSKLLMNESLMLAARRSVSIMGVVAVVRVVGGIVQISELWHDRIDAAKEAFVLLDHIKLIRTTTKASDCLAQVLG